MEKAMKEMTEEDNHKHQGSNIQQWEKEEDKAQTDLEARLKTQEYKEMLKRLK
jgi:hypothetical protein